MPPKKKSDGAVDATLPEIPAELLDQFVTGPMTAESVEAVMRKFKKAVLECALGAEMTHHLGYAPGGEKPAGSANHRNGSSGKTS
jgi:putative transposase